MAREKRRSSGLIRVPFVQRCRLEFENGEVRDVFTANVNMLGAYIADNVMPVPGMRLRVRFLVPGNDRELVIEGMVAWNNPQQNHPVHSLPAGFGFKFVSISPDDASRLQDAIEDYLDRHPGSR